MYTATFLALLFSNPIILLAAPPLCDLTIDNSEDCEALVAFYEATEEALPWPTTKATTLCNWEGVTCNAATGRVEELDVHNLLLRGSIPDDIGKLRDVKRLYLWANELGGSIPEALDGCANLTDLMLEENLLTGSLPAALGNLE